MAVVVVFAGPLPAVRCYGPRGQRRCMAIHRAKPKDTLAQRRPFSRSAAAAVQEYLEEQEPNFDLMLQGSELPVLVDWFAPKCVPCKMMGTTLEALAPKMQGKLRFVKVDAEKHNDLATKYAVRGMPTLLLFKGGRVVDRLTGAVPEVTFRSWLRRWGL